MPVYNGAQFLNEALQSLFSQTFQEFEILVIDDASTDGTASILSSYSDPRLKVYRNNGNSGVARSLNRGLKLISCEYIVRMDADDIAMPNRLAKQVLYMDANKNIGISGTWVKHIGRYNGVLERQPCGEGVVKAFMVLDNPLMHPTVIMRRDMIISHKLLYNQNFERCEDFDLWERSSQLFAVDNMNSALLHFRVHGGSVTQQYTMEMLDKTHEVLRRGLKRISVFPDDDQLRFHQHIAHGRTPVQLPEIVAAENWFNYLKIENKKYCVHSERAMHDALSFAWYRLCFNSSCLGISLWRVFNKSIFTDRSLAKSRQRIAIAFAILFHAVRRLKNDRMSVI
jgi:glycosyltransferase involved in cell wall biosynthesis